MREKSLTCIPKCACRAGGVGAWGQQANPQASPH